jgi:hypothetical protein
MASRPEVVREVRLLAFDAVRSKNLPADVTVEEQAEGLIAFAMALLRHQVGADAAALEGCRLVEKYRDAISKSYFEHDDDSDE